MNPATAARRLRESPEAALLGKVAVHLDPTIECHAVGGAVRDTLLGRREPDLDAVVSHGGEAVAEQLAVEWPGRLVRFTTRGFPILRVVSRGDPSRSVDLWDRQRGPLAGELLRRDFTVNALAVDLEPSAAPAVIDLCGGLHDLEHRRLVAITPGAIDDDPLRVLRAARLVAQLADYDFTVASDTVDLLRRAVVAGRLARVSDERIRDELARLWRSPGAGRGVHVLAQVGIYPEWWHGGRHATIEPQRQSPSELAEEKLRALFAHVDRRDERDIDATGRWVASLLALDTDAHGRLAALRRLRDDRLIVARDADRILRLLVALDGPERSLDRVGRTLAGTDGEPGQRVWLHELGEDADLAVTLRAAWRTVRGDEPAAIAREEETLRHLANEASVLRPARWLSGEQLQVEFGVPQGPLLGELLDALKVATVKGEISSRADAEEFARAYLVEIKR